MNEINEINDVEFWEKLESKEAKRKNKHLYKKSPEYKKLEEIFDKYTLEIPVEGDIIKAKYLGIKSDQLFFDVIGYKDNIMVDNRIGENKYLKNTNVGDEIDILITEVNNDDFSIKGSIAEIYENRAHASLKSLDENLVIMAQVKSLNPAGYSVDLIHDGVTLPGFMPNTLAGINKLYSPESIVGKNFEVMVESYSKEEGTYIVSRRKYLKTLIPVAIEQLRTDTIYKGNVTGTTPFGIFVEFNECLTGMIHKANVDPEWQEKLTEIKPGFEIEFYVKEIIKGKIILTQILRETLWDIIKNNQIIEGTIKETKPFGVLIHLDAETLGLIHTSEMGDKKYIPGKEIRVKVIAIDRQNRKIFLTAEN